MLVSVVIPTRNRPEMLGAAIDSVLAQTFKAYEIVVVINGPENAATPKTFEVATAAGCRMVRIEQSRCASKRTMHPVGGRGRAPRWQFSGRRSGRFRASLRICARASSLRC